MELIAVPLERGSTIVVETDHLPSGVVKAARPGQVIAQATQTLEEALGSVAPAAQAVLAKLHEARPDEISLEFGLILTAEAGAVISKVSGACHLKVGLRWERANDAGE